MLSTSWPCPPTILHETNHLLVVNKPAGWHSVPIHDSQSPKCLLQELKRQERGGGSRKDFLLPLHRLDQPCTGVLLYAKTSKAATRITKAWKQKKVIKTYLCLVQGSSLNSLQQNSRQLVPKVVMEEQSPTHPLPPWFELTGLLPVSSSPRRQNQLRTVHMIPQTATMDDDNTDDDDNTEEDIPPNRTTSPLHRVCCLQWRRLSPILSSSLSSSSNVALIEVQTTMGARHMVRALLSQVGGCPIVGDFRYGNHTIGHKNNHSPLRLSDQSVALHAYRVTLPTSVTLGTEPLLRDFRAPLPRLWELFGVELPEGY